MALRFRKERFEEAWDEAITLMQQHHDEVGPFRGEKLTASLNVFAGLEMGGSARLFTAREDDELLGYATFMIGANPNYVHLTQAVQSAIFIRPDKRGFGARFIDWCDAELKKDGVNVVFQYVSIHHDFSSTLLRLGYEKAETVYLRRLG